MIICIFGLHNLKSNYNFFSDKNGICNLKGIFYKRKKKQAKTLLLLLLLLLLLINNTLYYFYNKN